jgi:hypothetical protein
MSMLSTVPTKYYQIFYKRLNLKIDYYRNFKVTNVAAQGNCFMFNSEYNFNDPIMYTNKTRKKNKSQRLSSLTGPRFGLNLIVTLDQIQYMEGAITKQVR